MINFQKTTKLIKKIKSKSISISSKHIILSNMLIFLFLRIPSLLEPYWYGDEGIYSAVANEIIKGELLYVQIWDHKPPGIYLIYALTHNFQEAQIFVLKLINLILGLLTIFILYKIAKQVFKNKKISIFTSTFIATFLLGSTYLEANIFNAENIFILTTSIAIWIFLKFKKNNFQTKKQIFALGLIFGLGVFFKIHPIFDATALFIFLIINKYTTKKISQLFHLNLQKNLKLIFQILSDTITYFFGVFFFLILSGIYYFFINKFNYFFDSVIMYNFKYSENTLGDTGLGFIIYPDSLKLRLLLISIVLIIILFFVFKKKITQISAFLIIWAFFSFFAVKLSSRPYPHYLIQMIPPICLLIGLGIHKLIISKDKYIGFIKLSLILLLIYSFLALYSTQKLELGYVKETYLPQAYNYLFNKIDKNTWHNEFNTDAQRNFKLKNWLEKNNLQNENVFFYGNNPWIYKLAQINNPIRYTVYFHINERTEDEVIKDLVLSNTEYIVIDKNFKLNSKIKSYILPKFILLDTLENNRFELYVKQNSLIG